METLPLPTLPRRKADSHKGDYGKILVIAGSETMIGAPALVALAALRTGSGLVRIAAPKEIIPSILTICPYATAFAWSATKIKDLLAFAEEHDALAVGPGLGTAPAVKRLVLELLERHHGPMVFDADALNVLSALEPSEWPKRRNWSNIVLTPHMGEYMRLISAVMKRGANVALAPEALGADATLSPQLAGDASGGGGVTGSGKRPRSLADDDIDDSPSTADGMVLDLPEESASGDARDSIASPADALQSALNPAPHPAAAAEPDRTPLAELLARGTGTVVLLKGHRTVVTDGIHYAINTTGNPAMATAGSGDVLTGMIASLVGQKMPPLEAAVLGAHIHGAAGDLARNAIAPDAAGLLSSDLIDKIPHALAQRVGA
jgi:NAD(P)H-hydrate repair Nnr-like enzyme with NAD(P)H-hydrate dehydratase domain